MHKLLLCTLALSVAASLAACQSLTISVHDDEDQTQQAETVVIPEAEVGVSVAAPTQEKKYEEVPDLSSAEQLLVVHKPQPASNDLIPNDELITMSTHPELVRQNSSLSDNLPAAEHSSAVMVGAADPYSSVKEADSPLSAQAQYPTQPVFGIQQLPKQQEPKTQPATPAEQEFARYPQFSPNGCSLSLHAEAMGVARSLMYDTARRLKNEQGPLFIAPTIVSQEYNECVNDLAPALQDGLVAIPQFTVVPSNENLDNAISQNIGSSTILPRLIQQCRATGIPYLVISQVRKIGETAALSLRIIRTEDGITLSQNMKRLSE